MGTYGLSRKYVLTLIPKQFLEAYLSLHISILRRRASTARERGANTQSTTDAFHDRALLTLVFWSLIYQGEEGRGSDSREFAALRARIARAQTGGDETVNLWHEAVDTTNDEKKWLQRHPAALFKQLRQQAAAAYGLKELLNRKKRLNTADCFAF